MKTTDYLNDWLGLRLGMIELSTFEQETIYITRHLVPYFSVENKELVDLKPIDIQEYIRYKTLGGRLDGKSGGLSSSSIRKHMSILKMALNDAVLYGYIPSNPALNTKQKRRKNNTAKHMVLMTVEQCYEVLDAVKGSPYYLPTFLALYFGLRRSEVVGLRWSEIDLEKGVLNINHVVVKETTIIERDGAKSDSSIRSFELTDEMICFLSREKSSRSVLSDYVCTSINGARMRPDSLTRGFQRRLKARGLPMMCFHDLRRSSASMLFDMGMSIVDVQHYLGHADIETTTNIYLHYQKSRCKLTSQKMDCLFK